jgi:hypothetical protein
MMNLCGKMIKKGAMTEPRPCIRNKNHIGGRHTPDLIGMQFGNLVVTKLASPDTQNSDSNHTRWHVSGRKNPVRIMSLINSVNRGINPESGGLCFTRIAGKLRPEYPTSYSHLSLIIRGVSTYGKTSIYPSWDPRKNGVGLGKSAQLVVKWMIENDMMKPSKGSWQLHIIKPKRFFGPGGIRWVPECDRHDIASLDAIFNQSKKKQVVFHIKQLRALGVKMSCK